MPKSAAATNTEARAIKSHVPHFAIISAACSLLLWIITHFLVVSSLWRPASKTSATSHDRQPSPSPSRAYHQHQSQSHQLQFQHHHHHHYRWLSLIMLLLFAPNFFGTRQPALCHAIGYSYARFVGPVSGPEHEVIVHDALNGGTRVDYVARPEYQFAYGVEDSETHVLQNRKETRNGDAVKGVYSVVDPDGTLRVVKYTADDANGFQAEVITDGVATIHGQSNDGNNGGPHANNGANWHITSGNAVSHHSQDEADTNENDTDDEDDGGSDDANTVEDDVGSKHDYEVYEEHDEKNDHVDNDDDDDDAGKSSASTYSAESYEADEDDHGGEGYDESDQNDDDDYY